ncbi:MAG: tetratricopeptide repeat protein [Myxococcota bacterium]
MNDIVLGTPACNNRFVRWRHIDCTAVFQDKDNVSRAGMAVFVPTFWGGMAFMWIAAGCTTPSVHPDAVIHHNVGIEYLQAGKCEEAEERCRLALEYGTSFAHAHNCLGLVALNCRGDLDVAAQHFKDALARDGDFAEAHNNLGITFFRRTPPRYALACEEFEEAIRIDPRFTDGRENLGTCLMRQGMIAGKTGDLQARRARFALARSHLLRLTELAPTNFNAFHHLGFMDLVSDRYRSAEERFERCLELDPDNPMCSYNLGVLFLETARCHPAIDAFVRVLRTSEPSEVSVSARHNLAVAYELCAREDEALARELPALRRNPGSAEIHHRLGHLYAELGRPSQAIQTWRRAASLDPRFCAAHADLVRAHGATPSRREHCRALRECLERVDNPETDDRSALENCRG